MSAYRQNNTSMTNYTHIPTCTEINFGQTWNIGHQVHNQNMVHSLINYFFLSSVLLEIIYQLCQIEELLQSNHPIYGKGPGCL